MLLLPIKTKDLNYSYSNRTDGHVLKGIELSFEKGLFYSIVGPNGSGKTTLMRCLNNSLKTSKGSVFIDDRDISELTPNNIARKISFVPQNTVVDFEFSAIDIVLMGRSPYLKRFQNESDSDISIAKEAMEATDTWHLKDRNINEISGGERQRIIISRALAQQTPIMLLDEPASMMDIPHQVSILKSIRSIVLERNTTVIAVMHDLNMASRYSDQIILMNDGRVISTGTPSEVFTESNIYNVYGLKIKLIHDNDCGGNIIVPL